MVAVSTVSPGEVMNWNSQKSAARQNLLGGKAKNLYQRQLAEMDYSRNLRNFTQEADRARLNLPTDFARRGLLTSGLYQKALRDLATQRIQGLGDIQQGHQARLGGFILGDRDLEDEYAQTLMRILGEQYARQAQAATQIGGFL